MAKTATATVEDPRGLKRICLSCSTRFYDLNKRPIICPNCDTEYTGDMDVKGQKIVEEKSQVEESQMDDETDEDDDDTIVSLEDLDDDSDDDSDSDPDLEALKEIGEDVDDVDIDEADDMDVTLEEDDK
ncbi:MAG: TIGR02300 family protein [Bdellovibrionales bacterium]